MRTTILLILILCAVFISEKAQAENGRVKAVQKILSDRTDINLQASQETLASGRMMTLESAVQEALSHNPSLWAMLEGLGIADAERKAAILPSNPSLSTHIRYPEHDEAETNVEIAVEQNFIDLLLFPLKNDFAGSEYRRVELEVSRAVYEFSLEIKSAYYELLAAEEMFRLRENVFNSAEVSFEFANRQRDAGNINELTLAGEKALYEEAILELTQAEVDLKITRENLNRLMGFGGEEIMWTVEMETLPPLEDKELPLAELQEVALRNRLDLSALKQEIKTQKKALSLSRFEGFDESSAAFNTEKESDGERVTGPMLSAEIPLFNRGQASSQKAASRMKQAELERSALEKTIRSEIYSLYEKILAQRKAVEIYRESLVPLRMRIVELTQEQHNYMLMGIYQLLQAKRDEIEARSRYIDSLKDYWVLRTELERATGRKLPRKSSAHIEPKEKKKSENHSHDKHRGGHS